MWAFIFFIAVSNWSLFLVYYLYYKDVYNFTILYYYTDAILHSIHYADRYTD